MMHNIKTPEELLDYMKNNIQYGYLGNNGKIYHYNDFDFDKDWYQEYILENKDDVITNKVGNCWDQVEFEREWFKAKKYEVKTIFEIVNLDYKNNYPSHSYLVYKDEFNHWNWFENADYDNFGIHSFNTFNELIEYQYNKYLELLKKYHISQDEIEKIMIFEFNEPKKHINAPKYLNHVLNSSQLIKIEKIDN